MLVPTSESTVCKAMKPAKTATTATRPMPRAILPATTPSSHTSGLKKTNTAMNMLTRAPTSAASMTLMPTHGPASASRAQRTSHGVSGVLAIASASARNPMPRAISTDATPQQAPAKKVELNMAASAPNIAARDESFNARKNVQAPMPMINNATGARNFAQPTGPNANLINAVTPGVNAPPATPTSVKSSHVPVLAPGSLSQSTFC